jgi:hypothetical protein
MKKTRLYTSLFRRGGRDSNPRPKHSLQQPLSRRSHSATLAPPHIHLSASSPRPAEGEGFEPTVDFSTHVFKTCALSHSAIPPGEKKIITSLIRPCKQSERLFHCIPRIGSIFSFSWVLKHEMWGCTSYFMPPTPLGVGGRDNRPGFKRTGAVQKLLFGQPHVQPCS